MEFKRLVSYQIFLTHKRFVKNNLMFIFLLTVLGSPSSFATISFGALTSLSNSETKDINTAPSQSITVTDAYLDLSFKETSPLFLTLGYLILSSATPISATALSTLSSSNPYGGLKLFIFKNTVSLSATYFPSIQTDYTTTSAESWLGSGYYAKLLFHPKISNKFFLDVGVGYYSASFSSKFSTSSVSSVSNFSHTLIMPLLGLHVSF